MGEMIFIKATQEVKEVISVTSGLDDDENEFYLTVAEDGRAYTDDEFVTVATNEEVERATEEFMTNYKRGLANIAKYGVR